MENKNIWVIPTDKPSNGYILGKCIKELSDVRVGQFVKTYYMMFNKEYFEPQNIYITNDEKPKAGDWSMYQNKLHKCVEDIISDEFKKIILTTDVELIKDGVQAIDDEFMEWFVKNQSCERVEVKQEILKLVHNPNYVNHTPEGDGIYLTSKSEDLQYGETLIEDNVIDYKIIIPKEEPKEDLGYTTKLGIEVSDKMVRAVMIPNEYFGKEEPKQETLEEARTNSFIDFAKSNEDVSMYSFATGWDKCAKWQQEQDKRLFSNEEVQNLLILCKTRFGGSDLHDYVSDSEVVEWFERYKKK